MQGLGNPTSVIVELPSGILGFNFHGLCVTLNKTLRENAFSINLCRVRNTRGDRAVRRCCVTASLLVNVCRLMTDDVSKEKLGVLKPSV